MSVERRITMVFNEDRERAPLRVADGAGGAVHSKIATARMGLAVPPRILSGKPMKRN